MIKICKWTLGAILILLAVLLGIILAPVTFLALAFMVTEPFTLAISGAVVGGLVTGGLTYFLGRWFARSSRRPLSLGLGLGLTLLLLIASGIFLFRPRAFPEPPPVDPADVQFRSLSTGSRIAYRVIEARTPVRRGSVIFLHGGPGADAVTNQPFLAALSPLADAGFDLCLYDQIGSGLSARLDDPTEYTVSRQVDDLEALRLELGWESPILIGESWGAQLIARYGAEYPDAISAVVIVSPGPLRPQEWTDRETGSVSDRATDAETATFNDLLDPRMVTAMLLFRINPRAACGFMPETEAERYGSAILAALSPGAVCDKGVLNGLSPAPLNLWVAQMIRVSLEREPPDRLEGLARAGFPTLVLRGDCDYGHEDIAADYVNGFPRGELVSVADCGHFMLVEKPGEFLGQVLGFLDRAGF